MSEAPKKNRTYVGFSTAIAGGDGISELFDVELVKQDLMNNFMTSKGEVITDPSYGSIIWDMLFELSTEENINLMKNDSIAIFQAEKRVTLLSLDITPSSDTTMPGYTLTANLQYNGLGVAGTFTANFFKNLNDTGV